MPLCGNCFYELHTSGPCPLCGYDGTGKDKKHPQALRPGAILAGPPETIGAGFQVHLSR